MSLIVSPIPVRSESTYLPSKYLPEDDSSTMESFQALTKDPMKSNLLLFRREEQLSQSLFMVRKYSVT